MSARKLCGAAVPLACAALVGALALPGGSGAAAQRCGGFASQAAAQDHFLAAGGSPGRRVGALDPDRDGVACEGLGGPFKGYATIGFSKSKRFFYGAVTMPPDPAGGFACLDGNPHYPEGPRILTVYRARPGRDRAVTGEVAAEARRESGRLAWKAPRTRVTRGRYYAVFAERQRLKPSGPNLCPGFPSAARVLPEA
jgi:hypothetical protein